MSSFLQYISWDPIKGIEIGFFTLHIYSLMFIAAFLCGWKVMSEVFYKESIDKKHLDPLLLYTVVGTLIGARLGQVFFYDFPYFKNHWIEALLPLREKPGSSGFLQNYEFIGYRGLASHGATLGLIISSWLYSKYVLHRPFLWTCDRICIPIALGGALVRIGNFFNSEIVGKPTNLPWGVQFMQMDQEYGELVPRHPAQLYESLGYLCLFFILYFIYHKTPKKYHLGYLFGLFFTLLWSLRFLVEFIKEPQGKEVLYTNMLNTGQLLSIPFIITGLWLMATAGKRKFSLP